MRDNTLHASAMTSPLTDSWKPHWDDHNIELKSQDIIKLQKGQTWRSCPWMSIFTPFYRDKNDVALVFLVFDMLFLATQEMSFWRFRQCTAVDAFQSGFKKGFFLQMSVTWSHELLIDMCSLFPHRICSIRCECSTGLVFWLSLPRCRTLVTQY